MFSKVIPYKEGESLDESHPFSENHILYPS